ncbi:O-antigen polymerase [Desulfobacca acetoxidans DSM 11109]|uniref:O-antigen polymerase n=1 Tax=Desulfobacca acetoxidans (strain ATCC 700848 / DSM 11109 / ASRB2) TaxID=880072 RepID=F2NHY2_DESAR|nr:O-antigen polymerase [Desulfobacca acetoxidans DSM 11109]
MRSESTAISRALNPVSRVLASGSWLIWGSATVLAALAPLAYGAVHPWAYYTLGISLGLLSAFVLLQGIYTLWTTPYAALNWPRPPLWWAALGMAGLVVLHVYPWPAEVLQYFSPTALRLRSLGNGYGLADALPFSLNPYASGLEALKLWPAATIFYLLVYTGRSRTQLRLFFWLILGVALFEALYGFGQLRQNTIWGWRNPYTGFRLCGTFINSDHLAAYLTLAVLLGFGQFLAQRQEGPRPPENLRGWARVQRWSRSEYLEPWLQRHAWLFVVLILTTALIFTGSRGGMISLLIGFGIMGLLHQSRQAVRGHFYLIGFFLAAALIYSLFLGSLPYLARFQDLTDKGRYAAYQGALALWRDFPLLGSGLGTFGEVFYRYQPVELKEARFLDAHSDWLQLLAEGGTVGFILVGGAWLVFYLRMVRKWRQRRDQYVRSLGLGGLGALAGGAFHGLGEFPFHITAFTLTYAALAAVIYLLLQQHQPLGYFSYPRAALARRPKVLVILLLAVLLCQSALTVWAWHWWRAESTAPSEPDSTRRPVAARSAEDDRQALLDNPANSRYYSRIAVFLGKQTGSESGSFGDLEVLLKKAIHGAPAEWQYRYQLAEYYLRRAASAPNPYLPQALKEYAAATVLFPASGLLHLRLGTALNWAERYYSGLIPAELQDRAAYHLDQAVGLEPKLRKFLPPG